MKQLAIVLLLLVLVAAFVRLRSNDLSGMPVSNPGVPELQDNATPTVSLVPKELIVADDVVINTVGYTIIGKEITSATSLSLIPNFTQRLSARQIAQTHGCLMAINGGFYTKEGSPLGWFLSEGSQLGQLIQSNLATGFFWQDKNGSRHISRTAPDKEEVDFVLQTGPYMEVNNQQIQLISDEHARRSLIGGTSDGKLYILAVIEKENTFSGPQLADIPALFSLPEIQRRIPLETILNLDGGTASFFYSRANEQLFLLSELTPVGSLVCVKE